MAGLRIHHPELRSAIIEIPVPAKGPKGTAKRVQVVVDDTGHALVSEGVWGELQMAVANGDLHQFIIVNEVSDPPALVMGGQPDVGRDTYLVEREALQQIAPSGVNTRVVEHSIPQNIRSN